MTENSTTSTASEAAPFPEHLDDVDADSLARWLACDSTERGALNFTGLRAQNPVAWQHSHDALCASWALLYVLREIPPSLGDRLAKQIWSAWDEGSAPYELPAEWMAEYGMDADALIRRVQANRSEEASA